MPAYCARPTVSLSGEEISVTDTSEAEMIRAMAQLLSVAGQQSASEALRELRQAFPEFPLAVRVAALNALRGRGSAA